MKPLGLAFLMIVVPAAASGQQSPTNADLDREIRQQSERYFNAIEQRDVKTLDGLLLDKCMVYYPWGVSDTKAKLLKELSKPLPAAKPAATAEPVPAARPAAGTHFERREAATRRRHGDTDRRIGCEADRRTGRNQYDAADAGSGPPAGPLAADARPVVVGGRPSVYRVLEQLLPRKGPELQARAELVVRQSRHGALGPAGASTSAWARGGTPSISPSKVGR